MSLNGSQFKINATRSKKLPWIKLIFAGLGLSVLLIGSKNIFASSAPNTSAVLGTETTSKIVSVASAAPATTTTTQTQKIIKVANTPTGFLNVRYQPALTGTIIGKVYPGETYTYTTIENGWYRILFNSNHYGWVDGEYVISNN